MESAYRNTGFFMLALIICIALGFYKTYFGLDYNQFFELPGLIHLHAALATVWVSLLIVQPLMIRWRRLEVHRILGKLTYVLFPAMLLTNLFLLFQIGQRGDWAILFASSSNFFQILLFYVLAMINRKKTAAHARYMISTGLVLLDPTLGRVAVIFLSLPSVWGNHLPFLVTDLLLLLFIYGDWKNKRQFIPWIVVLGCFLGYQILAYLLFS